jgi:hypothetical protein
MGRKRRQQHRHRASPRANNSRIVPRPVVNASSSAAAPAQLSSSPLQHERDREQREERQRREERAHNEERTPDRSVREQQQMQEDHDVVSVVCVLCCGSAVFRLLFAFTCLVLSCLPILQSVCVCVCV